MFCMFFSGRWHTSTARGMFEGEGEICYFDKIVVVVRRMKGPKVGISLPPNSIFIVVANRKMSMVGCTADYSVRLLTF